MIDFADLGIRVNYSEADKAAAALDRLKAASERTEQSTDRVAASSVSATRGMGAWSALNAEAAGHLGEHSLALGRLERNLSGVTEKLLGLNPTLGLVSSSLLKFGIGTVETVGVLGGLALIAAAYEYMTKTAREAAEANNKLRDSLEAGNFKAALGPAPDLVLETNATRNQMMQDKEYRRQLINFGADPNSDKIKQLNVTIAHEADVLAAGEARLTKARMDASDPLEKVTVHARNFAEEARKAQEAFLRYQALVRDTSFSPESMGGESLSGRVRGTTATSIIRNTMTDKEQAAFWEPSVKASEDDAKSSAGYAVSEAMKAYKEGTGKWIDDATKHAKKTQEAIWGAAQASANTIVNALNIGGGGKGSSIGGALGSAAGGAAGYYFGGQAGEIVGSTVGGILGSLVGGLFDHGKAVREAAKAQRNINLELDQIAAGLSHNKLASALLAIEANLASTIASFNAALPGTRNEGQRNADIAQAKAYAEQQKQQAAAQIAADNKYASEDLAVRNLKALGHTDEANLVAFKEAQQRELAQAILDGRDATYQNSLITTQNSELIAYQNGLLSTALRNAPTGFYGAAAYIGQYATPRSADPFGTGMPAPNSPVDPTGGLTPPGGSRGRPPLPRDLTVNVMLPDGRVLTQAVIKDIDRTAASSGGAGSSRAAALELYN